MYHRQTASSISRSVFVSALAFYALSMLTVSADTLSVESDKASAKAETSVSSVQPDTVSCPAVFHNVAILNDATQCQQFETQMPAAMVYHSKQKPDDVVAFYQANMSALAVHAAVNQRTLLTSEHSYTRIVISPDNTGAQVDILVTPKPGIQ